MQNRWKQLENKSEKESITGVVFLSNSLILGLHLLHPTFDEENLHLQIRSQSVIYRLFGVVQLMGLTFDLIIDKYFA